MNLTREAELFGRALSVSSVKSVRVFDTVGGMEIFTFSSDYGYRGVSFSPDGRLLAAGGADGTLSLWDGTPIIVRQQLRK